MVKGYYIKKRKSFVDSDGLTRRLVMVSGKKAYTSPINKMQKNLKLKGYTHVSQYDGKNVFFEKFTRRRKK